jgi:predicted Zn finger-like uncharacterized protein
MAISCACPSCSTPFRVADELAGKRVKCPKCLMVFTLPATVPEPVMARNEPPSVKKVAAPINDLFREPEPRDTGRKASRRDTRDDDRDSDPDRDRDLPRSRRSKARGSGGSAMPWVLGLGGAAALLFLLCGGAVVVIGIATFTGQNKVAAVKNAPPGGPAPMQINVPIQPQPPVMPQGKVEGPKVQMVQGLGARVALTNGLFQTNDQLTVTDPADPKDIRFRCKLYRIDLQAGRSYVIDMESTAFDAYLRLEDANGRALMEDDDSGGNLNARMHFTPNQTGSFVIVATTFNDNTFGPFRLTVRESNVAKPGGMGGFKK